MHSSTKLKWWQVTKNSNVTTYRYGNLNPHISSSLCTSTLFQPYSAILFRAPLPRAALLQCCIFILPISALTSSSYQNLGLRYLHDPKNCFMLRHQNALIVTLAIMLYAEHNCARLLLVLYIHVLLTPNTSHTK